MNGLPLKTYSHFAAGPDPAPSEYDIVSSRLLYYVGKGFETDVPVADWYRDHQTGSPFRCLDWEAFSDPRQTTYSAYTALQAAKEAQVQRIFSSIEAGDHDRRLPGRVVDLMARAVTPLRYFFHVLQMVSAYVGQMAPSGRITIAALMQTGDEMRRVHDIAYRMGQLRLAHPTFGDDSKSLWERDPSWQPLRRLAERLLVTYDWGEAFAALNLCVKPTLDHFVLVEIGALARAAGDPSLGEILASLYEDTAWHISWSGSLVKLALKDTPENRGVLRGWIDKWSAPADEALRGLAGLEVLGGEAIGRSIEASRGAWRAALGDWGLDP